MSSIAIHRLDLQPKHLALLRQLLQQYVPQAEVWAYGSRVNGDGHEASDLDLVVRHPADLKQETDHLEDLRDALVESDLPIRVDVVDWARIPATFHREIERAYVVVQA
jgi:predicted nucleotidyltransferase